MRRGGAEIALTAREFALLEYLMRQRRRGGAKTELLAHVWDADCDGDPNVVEVYVGYLRRKIDQPFGRHALEHRARRRATGWLRTAADAAR